MEELKKTYPGESFFKLQQLIEESLYAFKLKKQNKDVSLHLIDDLVSPLSIKGDGAKLKEVLDLLLMNAVGILKATKIIVSLKQLLKTHSEVLLEFTIEDNGIKNIKNGNRLSFAYRRNLVIVKNLIEDFGGKTEISSLDGVGTTIKFLVKFPWEASPQELEPISYNKLAGKKILVAEDNEINQKIITHLLKKENIEADIANDGKEAVELFEKKEYDLLLLDLQMPHMDGFQTAKYIRKILHSNIPIIAMTAGAFANEQTRCFEIGINQYLSKPFAPEDLFLRLKYLLLNEHQLKHQKKQVPAATKDLYSLTSLKQSNDHEQTIEILEMFINKTPALLKEIKQAIDLKDIDAVVKKTAKLKGSLGSLQMQSMMRIINEMELFVRLEDTDKIPMAIERLHKEYEVVVPLIRKELNDMKLEAHDHNNPNNLFFSNPT
jgi:CheY-like chemotaxis protein